MSIASGEMYKYYKQQDVLPTYGNLATDDDLARYESGRRSLFRDKLHLHRAFFKDAQVLEFGPDSGENALVFAQWGARMTLVEPNPKAIPRIREYFDRFDLSDRLIEVVNRGLEDFEAKTEYDFIDAEGFIYTVQPSSLWLSLFQKLLRPGGMFAVSYMERYGSILELSLKAVHACLKEARDLDPVDGARTLFQAKWDSISHTRTFESWVMDVLENPFVRLRTLYDAAELMGDAAAHGFRLHGSWPTYADALAIHWHKEKIPSDDELNAARTHIARSRLGFFFGRKMYMGSAGRAELDDVKSTLDDLLLAIDRQIDGPDPASAGKCADHLSSVARMIGQETVFADDDGGKSAAVRTLNSLASIYGAIADGDMDRVQTICNTDAAFIGSWGLPYHFALFSKEPGNDGRA